MEWDFKCRLHQIFNALLNTYSNIINFDIVNVLDVFIETCPTWVTRRVSLVDQELLSLPEHMYSFTSGFLLGFVLLDL